MRLIYRCVFRGWGLAMASTVCGSEPPVSEDTVLESFFNEYLMAAFHHEPMMATRLGDHRFDDRLDDLSAAARSARSQHEIDTLAELSRRVRHEKLSRDGQIDYEIFSSHLKRLIWLDETFHPFEDDPRIYGEYITESVYLLLTQSSLPQAINVKNALSRMALIPRVMDVARTTIKNPPRVKAETAIRQAEGAIGFYEQDIFKLAPEQDAAALREKALPIASALKHHRDFLKNEVLPRTTDEWRIGPERFARKLELELDSGISAADVLAEAEREAARVESEMAVIARQYWGKIFPGKPVPLDDPEGRRLMIKQVLGVVADDHGSASTLVVDARGTVEDIKSSFVDQRIVRLNEPDALPDCRDAGVSPRQFGGVSESSAPSGRRGLE